MGRNIKKRVVRSQFIDEAINFSGNLQQFMYDNNLDRQDILDAMGLGYTYVFVHWLRENGMPKGENIRKFKEVHNISNEELYNENGNSHVNYYENINDFITDCLNNELCIKKGEQFRIDPRTVYLPYAGVVKYHDPELGGYNKFKDVYFVFEPILSKSAGLISRKSLTILQDKKTGYMDFVWRAAQSVLENEEESYVAYGKDPSVEVTEENRWSIARNSYYNNKIANVNYAIIVLEDQFRPLTENDTKPVYWKIKYSTHCNILELMRKFDVPTYTAFGHSIGVSDTYIRNINARKREFTEEQLSRIEKNYDMAPETLLHDADRDFIDIYEADMFAESYQYQDLNKADRVSALPINKSVIDSEYCFAMENPNRELSDFVFKGTENDISNYFVVDTRYSIEDINDNEPHLECMYDFWSEEVMFKWVQVNGEDVIVSDTMDMKKNTEIYNARMFFKKHERIGRVIQCYNYHVHKPDITRSTIIRNKDNSDN